jgi:hypothetical protein
MNIQFFSCAPHPNQVPLSGLFIALRLRQFLLQLGGVPKLAEARKEFGIFWVSLGEELLVIFTDEQAVVFNDGQYETLQYRVMQLFLVGEKVDILTL